MEMQYVQPAACLPGVSQHWSAVQYGTKKYFLRNAAFPGLFVFIFAREIWTLIGVGGLNAKIYGPSRNEYIYKGEEAVKLNTAFSI